MTSEELLQTIQQAKDEGWTELDLSDRELTELPDEIGELTALESFDLSGNELTVLPAAIGKLRGLRSLLLGRWDEEQRKFRGNQLSQLPSEIFLLANLTKLDLRGNHLNQLSSEIVQLTNLEYLFLSGNQLSQLPSEIVQLTKLTQLNLSGRKLLIQLPSEIFQLTNLTQLCLNGKQLRELPPDILNLTNLTQLSLNYNKLKQLPPEIGQLANLSRLDLHRNSLKQVPPEIFQLTALSQLDLSANQLFQLPPEICQLPSLSQLDLSGNGLRQLPPEIGKLTTLFHLNLSGNQLRELPPEIGQLAALSRLDLSSNQLRQLPPEIGNLNNLTHLYLDENQLSQLPPEIRTLTNLTEITLCGNQLSQLPSEIRTLTKLRLKILDLRGNQLPIPPEILGKSSHNLGKPADILKFYFEKGAKKPLNEAKLLVLGQSSVGKTSLVNRLLYDRFNPQEDKTHGINIQHWDIQVEDRTIQLNVWDFGGQEIMHATHQFFLTKRSLYLLVLDTRLGENENRLEYWLKIIQSFGGDSPVIVVGNKSDQQALDLDRRGLQLKYPSLKAFVETSCQTGEGIETLKIAIQQEIDRLAHVKDELPLSWFELKQTLEQLDRDYMPYREYQQLCQDQSIDDEQDQQLLIGFLHDLGVVLNFRDDPRLEDTNILNPVWVTNGVYQILNDNALMTQHQGVLGHEMLDRILPADRYPRNKHLFVIDMMRKFELCFDRVPDREFLIPDLLSKEEPYTGDWSDALAFQYHYNVLPGSVISRFIVRASAMIQQKTYWRSGVVLAQDGSRALVKADREDRKIWVRVSGAVTTRRQLLGTIRAHFDHIHRTITGIAVEAKVPLPGHPGIEVSYSHLLRLERMGETDYIPEGLGERVNVRQLLDGVESVQKREAQWNQCDRKYDFSHATIYGLSTEGRDNAQIAGQTVRNNQAIGSQHNASSEPLTQEQVMTLLTQIVQLIQQSDSILPAADKSKADKYMAAAKTELEEAEPDRQLIAKNLERTAKTLQTASQTVEAGQALWDQVSPILNEVTGWLGPTAAALWKILT